MIKEMVKDENDQWFKLDEKKMIKEAKIGFEI